MESVVAHAGVLGDLRRKAVFFNLLAKCAPELSEQFSPGFSRISHGVAAIEAQFLTNTAISEYAALCGLRGKSFPAALYPIFQYVARGIPQHAAHCVMHMH